jgi:hypothetical protein
MRIVKAIIYLGINIISFLLTSLFKFSCGGPIFTLRSPRVRIYEMTDLTLIILILSGNQTLALVSIIRSPGIPNPWTRGANVQPR